MKYNKEYIEKLLQRFMDGETTEQEEQTLTEYFSQSDSIPEEWEAYREMFASFATDAYDFSEEELNGFVKEDTPKPRIISLWPWLAAACVATLLIVLLAPPREETTEVAKVEETVSPKKEVKDSVKTSPIPRPQKEEKQLAQVTKRKTPAVKNSKPKQNKNKAETMPEHNELAMAEGTAATRGDELIADQQSQFEEMETAFRLHSTPIRERGQQVTHRVSMLQQQRRQQQLVEL